MKKIRRQIDKWTLFHAFGPMVVIYFLITIGFDPVYVLIYTIFLSLAWEIMDTIVHYFPVSGMFNNLFDKKGASWVDYAACGIGIGLYIVILYNNGIHVKYIWSIAITYIFGLVIAYILYLAGDYKNDRAI